MRQTLRLFEIGLRQIKRDGMLLVLLPAPFLIAFLFKFGIPYLNSILEARFAFSLLPWYGFVDGLLICLSPMFVAMVSAFLLLEERDEGITGFYQITPMGGYSYLMARIGYPIACAFIITVIAAELFHISRVSILTTLVASLISALAGLVLGMAIVSIAENRVEGLAVSKLMGISFLGLIAVWFIPTPFTYLAAFLPSFWIGKLLVDGVNISSFLLGLLTCILWIIILVKRFLGRVA